MSDIGVTWQDANIAGKLIQAGWGAEMDYPGIILDAESEELEGFIFTSQNLANHWPQLDGVKEKNINLYSHKLGLMMEILWIPMFML